MTPVPRTIDYYFTLVSPWASIGHRLFTEIATRHGARVRYRPVSLGVVFPESGGLPLAQRHPLRQRYRMLELQRWREKRGIAINVKPAHWPFDPTFIDCVAVALVAGDANPEPFVRRTFAAVFEDERDLTDPRVVEGILDQAGVDAAAMMKAAVSPEIKARYEANTKNAVAAGVFGSPAYVLDGEVFWGQDRLELLDDALTSGRAPFSA